MAAGEAQEKDRRALWHVNDAHGGDGGRTAAETLRGEPEGVSFVQLMYCTIDSDS